MSTQQKNWALREKTVSPQYEDHNACQLEREQRTMMLQAVQYLCKPVVASWLADWSGALHPTRAGTLRVPS